MRVRSRELLGRISGAHTNQFICMAQAVHQRGKKRRLPAHARHDLISTTDRTPISALECVQDGLSVHVRWGSLLDAVRAKLVLAARPADLEKLRSLDSIAADLADGYMPVGIAGNGHSRT
jgi:hypothetical protein